MFFKSRYNVRNNNYQSYNYYSSQEKRFYQQQRQAQFNYFAFLNSYYLNLIRYFSYHINYLISYFLNHRQITANYDKNIKMSYENLRRFNPNLAKSYDYFLKIDAITMTYINKWAQVHCENILALINQDYNNLMMLGHLQQLQSLYQQILPYVRHQ